MTLEERLFDNFLDNVNISDDRIVEFGSDTVANLTSANDEGEYTELIGIVNPPLQALSTEISGVDTGLSTQKGKTRVADGVMNSFKQTMSDNEGVIAYKLGGRETPAYIQFYPHGISEYSAAAKKSMTTLTKRVKDFATMYSAQLGEDLTALLQGFAGNWEEAREDQQQQKGGVKGSRTQRDIARTNLEIALLAVIYAIGRKFPGDKQKCVSFFNFNLLYRAKREHEAYKGTLAAQQIKEVLNRSLESNTKLIITNDDDNASIVVYLAATAGEQPNGLSKEVKPGHRITVKPIDIGNPDNTFLLVKNISAVNQGSFKIEVKGGGVEE